MSTVGQVIYNLQDYQGSGGYVSTKKEGYQTGNVITGIALDDANYKENRFDIFKTDIAAAFGTIQKLGIQAPPGTKFKINGNKTIMSGRTGIYELDDDIVVSSLIFEQPKIYKLNDSETQEKYLAGVKGFEDAEDARQAALDELNEKYIDKDRDDDYWEEYQGIQNIYNIAYEEAESNYIMGINGVYNTKPIDGELENVIIDFLY